MKTSNILAAAALSLLAVAGAHAETYEGVLKQTGTFTRADVNAQAVVAARSANPYATGATSSRVAPVLTASVDRSTVRAEAYAKAHSPNQNVRIESFANSKVPSQYTNGSLKIHAVRQASLGNTTAE
jgi:hypothetical protein